MRVVGLEQQRAHGRRQRQRHDQRDHRGAGDGEGELAVELAGNPGDEGRRARTPRTARARSRPAPRRPRPCFCTAASAGDSPAAMLRSTFSTTTMASSTTMPIASTSPNSERLLSVNPNTPMKKKVPTSDTGIATMRNDRGPPRLQEHDHDQHHQDDGLADGLDDGIDRLLDELGRVVDDGVFDARRKSLRHQRSWCR